MLTRVPFRFCSIALIMAVPTIPTAADFGKQETVTGKRSDYAARSTSSGFSPAAARRQSISLSLANEQGKKFVDNYLRHNDEDLNVVRKRSEGPFEIIDSVLGHYGLPLELRYLAVIESELKPTALSRVGARGPWQLMKTTAHDLGLKVNRKSDDRTNYYKSTVAAAKYLRDLHREFGDWLLVLAAYNGGPRPVYRAIHKAHSRSFWALQKFLPAESRGHVKKFIATAYYFELAEKADAAPKSDIRLVSAPARTSTSATESDDDKFNRLMTESAQSLKASNELLGN
ncbi:MAG TPA: lytic transglycosylase domain-containing protein [Puia sp.]|nr:lytic transglycosylase domain-containing protein [Puia sp.]